MVGVLVTPISDPGREQDTSEWVLGRECYPVIIDTRITAKRLG